MVARNIIKVTFSLLLLYLTVTCSKDEVTPRDYPRVRTSEVSKISMAGATFQADIIHPGNQKIIEYGFIWSQSNDPAISYSERKILAGEITTNSFSVEVTTTLKEGVTYYVKAFAKTDEYLVYGKVVSFVSLGSGAPKISSFGPQSGMYGDTILIKGSNFSYQRSNNSLKFDEFRSTVIESTDSTILATVPETLNSVLSTISVEIVGNNSNSTDDNFRLLAPSIESLSKNIGKSADTITVFGENFGNEIHHSNVSFNDKSATILDLNKNQISVLVPEGLSNPCKLAIKVGPQSSEVDFEYLQPEIVDFYPKLVTWGDTITVKVKNFYGYLDGQKLLLNNLVYGILNSSDSSIIFTVPNDIASASISVALEVSGEKHQFDELINIKPPEILSTSSDSIDFNETVLWYGNNFHPDLNEGVVYYQAFNGNYQYPIVAATVNNGALEFKFPELVDLRNTDVIDNTVTVTIKIGRTFSLSKQLVVKAPEVHSFSPLEVNNVFDEIKINGKNFGINPSVSLKGENLDIISSNGSQIVASIPATWVKNINISEFMSDSIIVTNDNNRITGSFVPFTFNYNCCAWARMDNMNGRYDNRKYYKSWSNNGYGYILGGVTGSNPYSLTYYDEFWQYDPISDDWTRLKDIPTTPSSQGKNAVFVHNDQTYVLLGGPEYSLMRYDQNNDTWTRLKDPPNFASITYNFNIDNRQFILLRSNLNVYEYKFDLDEWVIVSAMPESTIFYSYPHNGKQIVGFWGSKEYEFSPNTLSWTELRTTTYDYQIEILEDNSNHYLYDKYGNDHSLYLYEPSSNTKIIESEFPNTSDSNLYLFSIGGKHYFRNIEFVKYDPTFN